MADAFERRGERAERLDHVTGGFSCVPLPPCFPERLSDAAPLAPGN
jgi:hypothetical protein